MKGAYNTIILSARGTIQDYLLTLWLYVCIYSTSICSKIICSLFGCIYLRKYIHTQQLPCLRLRPPARRSRAPRGPIAFVAFVAFIATASLLAAAANTSSSGTVVVPAPLTPRGVAVVFGGGRGGVVVVVVIRVRAEASPRRQGDARLLRRQDGERRHALPDHHPPCPSPLATSS